MLGIRASHLLPIQYLHDICIPFLPTIHPTRSRGHHMLYLHTGTVLPKHIFHHIPLKLALAVRSGSVGAHNGDELAEGGSEEE